MDLPLFVPTKAVVTTLDHVLAHSHEDVTPRDHFIAVLLEEVGLQERRPGKAS